METKLKKYLNESSMTDENVKYIAEKHAKRIEHIKNKYMNELNKICIHAAGYLEDELKILWEEVEELTTNIGSLSSSEISLVENIIFTSIKGEDFKRVVDSIDQEILNFKDIME